MKFLKYIFLFLLAGFFFQILPGFSSFKSLPDIANAACPAIDISAINITHPVCGQNNGSITGIMISSTASKKNYTWRNSENDVIARTLDLTNIPSGTYTLEFSDNNGCSSVISPKIFVANANAVTIDDSGEVTADESCSGNGGITGIIVTGATTIEWHNVTTGAIVSTSATSADLVNVPAGTYQLYAYNSTCQATGKTFTVAHGIQVPTITDYQIVEPLCGDQGQLTVKLSVQKGQPDLTFFFADASGSVLSTGLIRDYIPNPTFIVSVSGGTTSLFVKDNNNCSILLGSFVVKEAELVIDYDQSTVTNETCGQHNGAIEPVFSGGHRPKPISQFTWTDTVTHQVVGVFKDLTGVGAGTYQVKIVDPKMCFTVGTFTVKNESPAVTPPKAGNIEMCLPGIAGIVASDTDTAGTFRLYAAQADTIPLFTSKQGLFYVDVKETSDFYIAYKHAECESSRTKITITVVASGIKIPSAFTPNNDGINDIWNISNLLKFPGAEVSVFTRNGERIYHSINYSTPFDGRYNGSYLPSGVYYYIIDLKVPLCFGKITGSLTIIR